MKVGLIEGAGKKQQPANKRMVTDCLLSVAKVANAPLSN